MTGNVPAGILLSAALFGMAHGYQGVSQALQIAVLGVMGESSPTGARACDRE